MTDQESTNTTDQESNEDKESTEESTAGREDLESGQTFDADYVKELRDEAAKWRTELRQLQKNHEAAQKKLKEIEEEELSEKERLEKRLDEREQELNDLQARYREHRLRNATERLARKVGFSDQAAEDAYALVDLAGVTEDDDGQFAGLEKALKDLLKAKPYMAASTNGQESNIDASKRGKGSKRPDEESLRRRFRI